MRRKTAKTALIKAPNAERKAEPRVEVLRGALEDHKQPAPAEPSFDLLAFLLEGRFLPAAVGRDLSRACPETVHVNRALKVLFRLYGCIHCPKDDPTVRIAAKLLQAGRPWKEIFHVCDVLNTRVERKRFDGKVRWELERLESKKPALEPDTSEYGSAGFCRRCYRALSKKTRELMKQSRALQGRNTVEETIALTLREDSAAHLLSCNEAEHQKIRDIALQRHTELRKEKPTITN
jgi:hypothetical protein